jgi:hypothetical protein
METASHKSMKATATEGKEKSQEQRSTSPRKSAHVATATGEKSHVNKRNTTPRRVRTEGTRQSL